MEEQNPACWVYGLTAQSESCRMFDAVSVLSCPLAPLFFLCMFFSSLCGFPDPACIWTTGRKMENNRVTLRFCSTINGERVGTQLSWFSLVQVCCEISKKKKNSGQEGRPTDASTGAKTRLGVRQNTGSLPPAVSALRAEGTPLLLLACRNGIHYWEMGLRRGCWDKRCSSPHHQPAPAVSIWLL